MPGDTNHAHPCGVCVTFLPPLPSFSTASRRHSRSTSALSTTDPVGQSGDLHDPRTPKASYLTFDLCMTPKTTPCHNCHLHAPPFCFSGQSSVVTLSRALNPLPSQKSDGPQKETLVDTWLTVAKGLTLWVHKVLMDCLYWLPRLPLNTLGTYG